MLSINKLKAGQDRYYVELSGDRVDVVESVGNGVEEYYVGGTEARGEWLGTGARQLRLTGHVDGEALRGVLAGRDPAGQVLRTSPVPVRVVGFDLTFSAPKSVSVLFGLGEPEVRAAVRRAHDRAVCEALNTWSPRRAPSGVGSAGVGLGYGDRDEEDRDAQPVIETALDVQALPDTGRDAFIGDNRLTERGIRAREHHREHRSLRDTDPRDHQGAHEGARDDREREADAQQPQRHGELPTQRAQRDPRGIREEHERQRDLGQKLDLLALEPEVEQPEHRPGEQPGRREEHRARHADQLQPS